MPKAHQNSDAISAPGKQKILAAALELFAEHGYTGTSIREVAESAGQSFALVRFHFKSKLGLKSAVDEYVIKFINDSIVEFEQKEADYFEVNLWLDASRKISSESSIYKYIRRATLENDPSSIKILQTYYSLHKTMIAKGVEKGVVRANVDQKYTSLMSMFITLGPMLFSTMVEHEFGVSVYDEEFEAQLKQAQRDVSLSGITAK